MTANGAFEAAPKSTIDAHRPGPATGRLRGAALLAFAASLLAACATTENPSDETTLEQSAVSSTLSGGDFDVQVADAGDAVVDGVIVEDAD